MDFLNLVTALNERFGIPIPEPDYPRLATFSEAIAYLGEKVIRCTRNCAGFVRRSAGNAEGSV